MILLLPFAILNKNAALEVLTGNCRRCLHFLHFHLLKCEWVSKNSLLLALDNAITTFFLGFQPLFWCEFQALQLIKKNLDRL